MDNMKRTGFILGILTFAVTSRTNAWAYLGSLLMCILVLYWHLFALLGTTNSTTLAPQAHCDTLPSFLKVLHIPS